MRWGESVECGNYKSLEPQMEKALLLRDAGCNLWNESTRCKFHLFYVLEEQGHMGEDSPWMDPDCKDHKVHNQHFEVGWETDY